MGGNAREPSPSSRDRLSTNQRRPRPPAPGTYFRGPIGKSLERGKQAAPLDLEDGRSHPPAEHALTGHGSGRGQPDPTLATVPQTIRPFT
jgi:hypothetical protein